MSELVKRLRKACGHPRETATQKAAADFIEAQATRIVELEASLADSNEALQVMGLKLAQAEALPAWTFNVFEGAPPEGSASWTEFLTNSHKAKNYSGLVLRSQRLAANCSSADARNAGESDRTSDSQMNKQDFTRTTNE